MELPEQTARTEMLEIRAIFLIRGSRGPNWPQIPHVMVFSCVLRTQNRRAKKYKTIEYCRTSCHLPIDKNHRTKRILGACALLHTYTVIFILVKVFLCLTCTMEITQIYLSFCCAIFKVP